MLTRLNLRARTLGSRLRKSLSRAFYTEASAPPGEELDEPTGKLEALLAHRQGSDYGAVHVLDLRHLQAEFRERWSAVEQRVLNVAESVLRHRLDKADVYLREGHCFLIVFANLTAQAANAKAAIMAAEIERRILGSDFDDRRQRVLASALHLGQNRIEKLSPALFAASGAPGGDVGHTPLLTQVGAGAMLVREQQPPSADYGVAMEKEWEHQADRSALDPQWQAIQPSRKREQSWELILTEPPIDLETVECAYRRAWDVRSKTVAGFHCAPLWNDSGAPCTVASERRPVAALQIDLKVLRRVADDLAILDPALRPVLVSLPVHFHTLFRPTMRDTFLRECRSRLPFAKESVLCELVDIPPGAPEFAMWETVTAASSNFRTTALQWTLGGPSLNKLRGLPVTMVGIHLRAGAVLEAKWLSPLTRFAAAARAARLSGYVRGAISQQQAATLADAGFRFVDGESIPSIGEHH